jgi:hypothetical protein
MYSSETQMKIAELRTKSREGTLTMEEVREAIKLLRGDRVAAAATSAKSRTAKAAGKVKPDGDALLGELEGI